MPLESDYNAERVARIELLMEEAKHVLAGGQVECAVATDLRARLDKTLKELGAFTPS